MHQRQEQSADCAHAFRALHYSFMPLDALLEFVQTTRLAIAKQRSHLRLQYRKISEDLSFKIGHSG